MRLKSAAANIIRLIGSVLGSVIGLTWAEFFPELFYVGSVHGNNYAEWKWEGDQQGRGREREDDADEMRGRPSSIRAKR